MNKNINKKIKINKKINPNLLILNNIPEEDNKEE